MKQPPHSIITDYRAHVHKMEGKPYHPHLMRALSRSTAAGGIAMFSQATTHQLFPSDGIHLTAEDIQPALVLGTNLHTAPTKLICLENTLSGIIFPQEEVVKISKMAKEHDIGMHLDGARIWNVAAASIERRGLDPTSESDRRTV